MEQLIGGADRLSDAFEAGCVACKNLRLEIAPSVPYCCRQDPWAHDIKPCTARVAISDLGDIWTSRPQHGCLRFCGQEPTDSLADVCHYLLSQKVPNPNTRRRRIFQFAEMSSQACVYAFFILVGWTMGSRLFQCFRPEDSSRL